jgi:hypothetical protein
MLRVSSSDGAAVKAILAASMAFILVGSRAALIGYAGGSTPLVDEWDGDWGGLLKPYLDGQLRIDSLTAPFMEHRILFTRLVVLSLFRLTGYWDVVLQMCVNAVLGAAVLVAMTLALARVLSGGWTAAAIVAPCLVNVIPFSYDNVLLGFNTHFYLLPALSLLGLWLAVGSRAWSARWVAGVLCGAASFFCMASGALTLVALLVAHLLQMACGRRHGVREAFGIAALVAATGVMLSFVPHVPESDAFRARSVGEFLAAASLLAGWPAGRIVGLLLPLPSALFLLRALIDRPGLTDARWFSVAALVWVVVQIAALAAGRAQAVTQSRYLDILMLGVTIHFVSALWLLQTQAFGAKQKRVMAVALAVWVALVALSLARAERHLPRQIEAWRHTVEMAGENVRGYLATGYKSFLYGPPVPVIPYPDPDRLRQYLDAPVIRASLAPELAGREPPRNGTEAFKQSFLEFAPGWIALGLVTLLVGLTWPRVAPSETSPDAPEREEPIAQSPHEAPLRYYPQR